MNGITGWWAIFLILETNLWAMPKNKSRFFFPKTTNQTNVGSFNNEYIEYESEGSQVLSIEQYLNEIIQYLGGMINELRTPSEWKIQLIMKTKFLLLKDNNESITELFFNSLLHRQQVLEQFTEGSQS